MNEYLCKFGGSSLSSAAQMRKVSNIIKSNHRRRYVVVSAPGKSHPDETKITDLLIALASAITNDFPSEDLITQIADRYGKIADELALDTDYRELVKQDILDRISKYSHSYVHLVDALKASGEDNNAKLFAEHLRSIGLDANYVSPHDVGLYLEKNKGVVRPLPEAYENIREALLDRTDIIVFPGFFGCTLEGEILTFTRGGSDISGSILAAALHVEKYENFTDVDAVYSVRPDLVKNPMPIREMTYDEMRELAYTGFNILHEDALEPVRRQNIPLQIKSIDDPEGHGTYIVGKRMDFEGIMTGISGKKGFCVLHVEKYLMNQEVGFALDVIRIIAELNVPFEHMPTGIDSLSIIFREDVLTPDKERLLVTRILKELNVDACYVTHELAIIMAVGIAMKNAVGVLGRAVNALSNAGINIELVVQGPSEISILFGIKDNLCNYAIRELYKSFFRN